MPAKDIKPLFVRLTEAEKRHIKTLAVSQGLTLREAILQAFAAWASQFPSGGARPVDPLPGAHVDADHEKPGEPNRVGKPKQDRRRTEAKPAATSGGGQAANPKAAPVEWLRRAARLQWSKCPAAEKVSWENAGKVWVVRGTRVPLDAIFAALDDGQPPGDLLNASGLTREQLMAILQFVAQKPVI